MDIGLNMLPQILLDGLIVGFLYAVVALGYTMVYGVLEFINFAHSEIFMVGAFLGAEVLLLIQKLGLLGSMPEWVSLLLGLVIAMAGSGLLGVTVERVAYRPLRGAPKLVSLITAIGVSFFLQDAVRMVWSVARNNWQLGVPAIYKGSSTTTIGSVQMSVPYTAIIIMVVAVLMMLALTTFVNKSKTGKAMRAVAQDRTTAALMGINVNKIISTTFLVGGALGGAAGALFAVRYTNINPYIGFVLGIKAFTAAVFGGIGNLSGAMLGGIVLGVVESLCAGYLGILTGGALNGSEYKDIFAFMLLIIILIFKPAGLLGRAASEKV